MERDRAADTNGSESGGDVHITAVICDDHPAFAKGLATLLAVEAEDILVAGIASSGRQAEQMVRELLPDIVVMDVRMPGMDGIETARKVKAASPTTKILMLTVSEDATDLYAALRAGAIGYVTKDRDVSEIADAIRWVMKGHFVVPVDLADRFITDLDRADPGALSDVEREILAGIAKGETNRDIGRRLHLSERTIRRRLEDIYLKLHLADRLEAAIYATQRGIGKPAERAQ